MAVPKKCQRTTTCWISLRVCANRRQGYAPKSALPGVVSARGRRDCNRIRRGDPTTDAMFGMGGPSMANRDDDAGGAAAEPAGRETARGGASRHEERSQDEWAIQREQ